MRGNMLGCEIPLMSLKKAVGSQDRLVWSGDMFCGLCPDAGRLPTFCGGDCSPGRANYCVSGQLAGCPCTRPATFERWAAFRVWLKGRERNGEK